MVALLFLALIVCAVYFLDIYGQSIFRESPTVSYVPSLLDRLKNVTEKDFLSKRALAQK
jgi:hypothetical protein